MSFKEAISQSFNVAFRQFQTFGQVAIDGAVVLENLVARGVNVFASNLPTNGSIRWLG
jgi:hypothetical protein